MSRAPLPRDRVVPKEKGKSRLLGQGNNETKKSKVDPIYEHTEEQVNRGGEFSADEEPGPEDELYRKIQREKNKPNSSKDQQFHSKGRPGERAHRTDEVNDGNDRNREADRKFAQKQQQEDIFTTAFKYQLGIILVMVFTSLLAHYCLCSHLLHNFNVSDSQKTSPSDTHSKIDEAIKKQFKNAYIDKKVNDALNNADIDSQVKQKINDALADFDFKNTVKSSFDSEASHVINDKADNIISTKLNEVDIDEKVQNALRNANIDADVKSKVKDSVAEVDIDNIVKLSLQNQALDIIIQETDKNPQLTNAVESKVSDKIKSDLNNLFNEAMKDVEQKKDQFSQWFDNNRKMIPDLQEFDNLKQNTEAMSEKYSKLLSMQESIKEENIKLVGMQADFGNLQNKISEAVEQYEKHKNRIDEIKKELEVIQPNTFNKENFMMAFMILTVIVCLLAVAVFNIYQRGNYTGSGRTDGQTPTGQRKKDMNKNEILGRISRNPKLEPGICVISYDENRTETHRKLLDSLNIAQCNIKSHVIRRHEQILDLPRCNVYLMCTEFSERHVIIEEQGLGLGDLHRTTYDAVIKLGGSLIILYTRDPGSKRLKKDALYNTNIYCVNKQPELSVLEKENCFFSTYDALTDYQKTELHKKIVSKMA